MHKVNRELEKMKSFPCFDCPATFSNFPSLCEHSKMHSVTLRPAAVESTKISAAAVAKNRILKKAIRGKIEFSSNRPKSLKKTAHYCTVCSPPRAFGQAISLRSHLEQFHRAVIKDTKFVTKNGKTGTLDECESEVEVPKQIVKEDPADLIKNELPVADRKYQVRPMVRRRRKIYECVRCQEQFHDEYSHTQHVLAHDRSENATCRMCDPPEEFKGESAYWRHLRSAHGVTAAGRLHPVKMHPAGKKLQEALIKEEEADEGQLGEFVEELDEDVEMEEGPTLTAQLEQDLEEEEVDEEEVEKFWHQQLAPIGSLPLAVQDDDLGPVDEDKRKPGQVAAKRPRSIFQSLDSPSKAENQHEEDNDSGDDDDVMETDEPDDDEEEGVKVARALHEEEMLKLGVFVQSEKRYRCLICGRAVGGRAKLVAHASNHSRKQLLSCPECPKSFREPESLEHHLEEHEVKVKRGYRCKICMEAFTSANWKEDFLEHMREHLGPEACVCEVCSPPEHFSDADDLQAHIDAVHGFEKDETTDEEGNDDRAEEEDDVLVDEDDDVVVEKDDDVVEEDDDVVAEEDDDVVAVEDYHVRADVPVAVKTEPKLPSLNSLDVYPQCTHCPARFINLRAVENHIRVAHELPEKPATAVVTTVRAQVGPTAAGSESECGHCRKLFIHHDALEAHVRQEHPEGNSKGSKRANSMPERAKADMVSSQDACDPTLTDQTCPYCRAQFETHRQLAGHFLQHSWNRPAGLQKSDKRYPCKFCPEVFRALYQLVVHVNDGHADAPAGIFDFQCEECGDYFINPLKLHLHMAKLHAGEPPKNPRNMKFGGNMPWKSSPSKAGMGERSSMTPPKAAVKKRTPTVVKSAPAKTGSGDFGCHICESRFETSRGLAGHISRRHGKQASPGDRRANEGDHDEESRSPPAKKAKVSLDEASDYDVIYCKHCNVAYGGSTRKYHLNCPGKLSPPPSDVAEQSSGNMSDTKLAPSGTPTKDVEIVEQDKCPDCNLSYIFESPEKHVNACPLGPRRVVVSPRGLKTYRNQSVCVSARDRSMTMEMLAGGDKQFRVIEVSSKRIRKPSLKMLDVYDTQASQKVEAANRKWLCTPRKQHPANYTSVETQTNDSDFDDDEASPSYPTGAFCGKCGEKFSGRLSRIGHDKNCPGLSPFLRSVKGKPDPLAASTSDAAATDGEHKPSLENVVVKDEVFPMSDDEAATNMVEDMLES